MDRRTFVGTSGVAIAVALAGCSGTLSGSGSGADGDGSGSTTVTMSGTDFEPRSLDVDPGQTVTWSNEGSNTHSIEAASLTDAGAEWSFTAEDLGSGDTATHTFETAGAYEYYCPIHGKDTMCGVVIVGDTSYDGTLPCEDSSGDGGGGGAY